MTSDGPDGGAQLSGSGAIGSDLSLSDASGVPFPMPPTDDAAQLALNLGAVAQEVIARKGAAVSDSVRAAELGVIALLISCLELGSWGLCPMVMQDWRREGELKPSDHLSRLQALEALRGDLEVGMEAGDNEAVSEVAGWMASSLVSEPMTVRSEWDAPVPDDPVVQQALVAALTKGTFAEVEGLLLAAAETRDSDALIRAVVAPAIGALGDRWQSGEVSEAHAARAGRILETVSMRVLATVNPTGPQGRVLVFVADGDPHRLGARVVADLFGALNWDAILVDAAQTDLDSVVRRFAPDVIAISVTLASGAGQFAQKIRDWRDRAQTDTVVLGGGRVLARAPELGGLLGCDMTARSATEGALILQRWWASAH